MRFTTRTRTTAAVVTAAFLLAACGGTTEETPVEEAPAAEAPAEEAPAEEAAGTIVEVAVAAGDFTTLVAAVEAAGFRGAGVFTAAVYVREGREYPIFLLTAHR